MVLMLVIVALLVGNAVTAIAKKPPPKPASDLVDMTMTLAGPEGLTTGCDDADGIAGSLLMERTRSGLVSVEGVAPVLGLFMDEVPWWRAHPGSSGTGFAGCHGGTVTGSPGTWDGWLSITIDREGAVTDLLWHFDYYVDGETRVLPNGKVRYTETVRENLTLSGSDLTWNEATATVSGVFTVSHFLRKDDTYIDYEPFGSRNLTFTLTTGPHT
jgi:hypothetical protein